MVSLRLALHPDRSLAYGTFNSIMIHFLQVQFIHWYKAAPNHRITIVARQSQLSFLSSLCTRKAEIWAQVEFDRSTIELTHQFLTHYTLNEMRMKLCALKSPTTLFLDCVTCQIFSTQTLVGNDSTKSGNCKSL